MRGNWSISVHIMASRKDRLHRCPHFLMQQGDINGQFLQWHGLCAPVTIVSRGIAFHPGLLLNNTEARRKCTKKVENVKHVVRSEHTLPHAHTTHDFALSSITVNTNAISITIIIQNKNSLFRIKILKTCCTIHLQS